MTGEGISGTDFLRVPPKNLAPKSTNYLKIQIQCQIGKKFGHKRNQLPMILVENTNLIMQLVLSLMDSISSCRAAGTSTHDTDDLVRGLKDAMPVMAGFAAFALVLGAQAAQKGFLPFEVPLMTGLNFGGGSEFAAVSLWTTPPHVLLIVAVTLLVNSRHLLMGAVLAPFLQRLPRREVLPALFFMCDESWAMGLADARQRAKAGLADTFCLRYYLGVSLGLYLTWVVSTAVGAALGPAIGDVEVWGFQMAFPAVFLVLLRGMWKGLRAARPWMVALAVAAATYLMLPGAWYVLAGAISGLVAAWFLGEQS